MYVRVPTLPGKSGNGLEFENHFQDWGKVGNLMYIAKKSGKTKEN